MRKKGTSRQKYKKGVAIKILFREKEVEWSELTKTITKRGGCLPYETWIDNTTDNTNDYTWQGTTTKDIYSDSTGGNENYPIKTITVDSATPHWVHPLRYTSTISSGRNGCGGNFMGAIWNGPPIGNLPNTSINTSQLQRALAATTYSYNVNIGRLTKLSEDELVGTSEKFETITFKNSTVGILIGKIKEKDCEKDMPDQLLFQEEKDSVWKVFIPAVSKIMLIDQFYFNAI